MSVAANLKNEKDRKVVAVIGDAAIAGGLAFEGLNNASTNPNNLLIILNDNNMAIDNNVGSFPSLFVSYQHLALLQRHAVQTLPSVGKNASRLRTTERCHTPFQQ